MSCGVGRRHGLDLALLWLWRKLAAVAPTRPLAWEPPHTTGVAPEKTKDKKKKKSYRHLTKPLWFSSLGMLGSIID